MSTTYRVCSAGLALLLAGCAAPERPKNAAPATEAPPVVGAAFPPALVDFAPHPDNPVFTAGAPGDWDATIRERGWILRVGDTYHLWYTGYDGTREGLKTLGYATSNDGLRWQRHPHNPVYREHWVEDMCIVRHDGTYHMFAEGRNDQPHLLVSADGIHWTRRGPLDIRYTSGQPLSSGPYGTPTAWHEDGIWYLFYERRDQGVWLATSTDLDIWTSVQDEPVLQPGPDAYDGVMIALNQIIKHKGRYYALYHGSGDTERPRQWSTAIATSTDLVHWTKYAKNPLLRDNKSSGVFVHDGRRYRLYSMHGEVQVHFPRALPSASPAPTPAASAAAAATADADP